MAQRSELPLPDYDELPLNSLKHEIRSLRDDQLRTLFDHEREHANRVPVIELLATRLKELAEGAEPSGGDQQAHSGKPDDTRHGSPISQGGASKPSGPLRHGVAGQTPERDRP
jgi:hypothetical protein